MELNLCYTSLIIEGKESTMELTNINNIEITRDNASEIIKVLEDQQSLSDKSKQILEFLKRAVKAPELEEVDGIPTWAIYYLEYGEDSDLGENDREMIEDFLKSNHYKFSSVKYSDGSPFDSHPQFGNACSTCTCYFEIMK